MTNQKKTMLCMRRDLHLQELTANRCHRRPLIHPMPANLPSHSHIYTVMQTIQNSV